MGKITMGNDDFILYIRKQNPTCVLNNSQLGRLICKWLKDNSYIKKSIKYNQPCLWGRKEYSPNTPVNRRLPYTAAQFEFDQTILPKLYNFLGSL